MVRESRIAPDRRTARVVSLLEVAPRQDDLSAHYS
jgi:hypothetical protein